MKNKMPSWRLRLSAVVACSYFGIAALFSATTAKAQSEPVLYPTLECVERQDNGLVLARFGYVNNSRVTYDLPVYDPNEPSDDLEPVSANYTYANFFTGPEKNLGQPTTFAPGQFYLAFDVLIDPAALLEEENGPSIIDEENWQVRWYLSNQRSVSVSSWMVDDSKSLVVAGQE